MDTAVLLIRVCDAAAEFVEMAEKLFDAPVLESCSCSSAGCAKLALTYIRTVPVVEVMLENAGFTR